MDLFLIPIVAIICGAAGTVGIVAIVMNFRIQEMKHKEVMANLELERKKFEASPSGQSREGEN